MCLYMCILHQTCLHEAVRLHTQFNGWIYLCNRLFLIMQFTDAAEANFKTSTEEIINMYCSTYTRACVSANSPM